MKSLVCDICGKPYTREITWRGGYRPHISTDYRIKVYETKEEGGIMNKLDVCQTCANKIRTFIKEDYLTKDEIREIVDKEKVPHYNDDNVIWNNALTYLAKQFELAMKSKK